MKGKGPDGKDVNYQLEEIEMEKELGVFVDKLCFNSRATSHKLHQKPTEHFW